MPTALRAGHRYPLPQGGTGSKLRGGTLNAIADMARLTKAGVVLAWSGARVLPDDIELPAPLVLFGRVTSPLRKNGAMEDGNEAKLSTALTSLGPSYIKLGQFLA